MRHFFHTRWGDSCLQIRTRGRI